MKIAIFLFFTIIYGSLSAQSQNTTDVVLFAQCMFSIPDQAEMNNLQEEMSAIPYVEMVRLDWHTQRALIITHNLDTLNEEDFKSWFGQFSSTIYCVQIGVHGVDPMAMYPFTNCQN